MISEAVRSVTQQRAAITVLLVDDNAIWRGAVQSMLHDSEFAIVGEAASSKEALEAACHLLPQLTLLDIRMAGGNGLETLIALKKEHPQMNVVMLSTYDNLPLKTRALALGAAGYLVKGIDRDHLLATLRAAFPAPSNDAA